MRASQTELTATVAEVVPIDDKTSQSVDAYLDHDLFQGLIEATNTNFRLFTSNRLGFHRLYPYS
jgi:transposase